MGRLLNKLQYIYAHIRFKGRMVLGRNVRFNPRNILRIAKGSKMILDDSVCFLKTCLVSVPKGEMKIGRGTYFNANLYMVCREKIEIGSNCMFGPNCTIVDHDHEFSGERILRDKFKSAPILIGDNVWCGANVVILKGTSIGEGTIIGAGSVVHGMIPPHSIVTTNRNLQIRAIQTHDSRCSS